MTCRTNSHRRFKCIHRRTRPPFVFIYKPFMHNVMKTCSWSIQGAWRFPCSHGVVMRPKGPTCTSKHLCDLVPSMKKVPSIDPLLVGSGVKLRYSNVSPTSITGWRPTTPGPPTCNMQYAMHNMHREANIREKKKQELGTHITAHTALGSFYWGSSRFCKVNQQYTSITGWRQGRQPAIQCIQSPLSSREKWTYTQRWIKSRSSKLSSTQLS